MFFADLSQPFWCALGWALLHSLWQGGLLAVALAVALSLLKGRSASLRYALACAALALMLAAPAATFWSFNSTIPGVEVDEISLARHGSGGYATAPDENSAQVEGATRAVAGGVGEAPQRASARGFEQLLSWLSLAWFLGVLTLSARTLGGVAVARRLKRRAGDVTEEWQQKLAELSQRLRVRRRVRLLESALVQVPTVVGWLRPVILVPASVFVGLTPSQLETLLAHELAHVRRHDYLVNLLQTLAETLLFYHPAVWWVSRRVRVEREHACDDLAVAACGDALVYARALANMERVRAASRARLALAADGGDLRARVLRLVGSRRAPRASASPLVGVFLLAALLAGGGFALASLSQKNRVAARTDDAARKKVETNKARTADEGSIIGEGDAADDGRVASDARAQVLNPEVAQLIAADVTEGEDADVRRAAVTALASRAGTVVVMDARTGRVYAVVNQEWALRRGWQPASTMKLVTAMAGIESKSFDPSAKTRVSDRSWRLDLTDALAISDNDYFKALSERVGAEKIVAYARGVGLGEPTGVNYEGETAGRVPDGGTEQSAGRLGALGEGVEVTPMQLATLVAAVANGGSLLTPQVPRGRQGGEVAPLVRRRLNVSSETLARIVAGMTAAVERGTGAGAKGSAPKLAAKTGSLAAKDASLGIFASFAPADDPRLVVVVLTQGRGESGPAVAGIAGAIYKSLGKRL